MSAAVHVLYVDDEPSHLVLGKQFLERSGDFTVTTAISAPDAIRLLEEESFDTIVSDYQMPEMNGIEFLVLVRTKFGQIPFILFTGKGREEVVIAALNAGADGYLQKGGESGAQFAELSHKIKTAASQKRADDALRESETKYRSIFDNAVMGIYQISREGQFLSANNHAARTFGYESAEELILSITDVYTQIYQDPKTGKVAWRILLEKGVLENFEAPCRHKNGQTVWVSFNARLVRDAYGNILYHEGISQDITKHKRGEEALQ